MRRVWAAAFLGGLAALLPGPAAAAAPAARVGLFVETGPAANEEVAAGLRDALRNAVADGRTVEVLERATPADESEMRAALAELAIEGVEVVAAVGDTAARIAPESIRDRSVVAVSADGAAPAGGRVHGVAMTPDPARAAEELLRVAPGARRIAVVGPLAGSADALVAALQSKGPGGPAVVRVMWSETGGFRSPGIGGADVVLASPDTPTAEVTDLARALSGQGAALVGSRADHLDAGAAIVLRPALRDVGALAAAACVDALAGNSAAPRTRRPRRLLREVHLPNARRLGFPVPLTVLASSDRTVVPPPERK